MIPKVLLAILELEAKLFAVPWQSRETEVAKDLNETQISRPSERLQAYHNGHQVTPCWYARWTLDICRRRGAFPLFSTTLPNIDSHCRTCGTTPLGFRVHTAPMVRRHVCRFGISGGYEGGLFLEDLGTVHLRVRSTARLRYFRKGLIGC